MRKSKELFFAILLNLLVLPLSYCEEYSVPHTTLRFERISVDEGLPHPTVLSVIQDRLGFIWFGTQDGLCRYDGYEFTTFRHDSDDSLSISNSNIFALFEDDAGYIWAGTDGGGLNRFDPQTETFTQYCHNDQDSTSISNDSIWSIAGANDGYIWVGTRNGLNLLDPSTGTFKRYMPDPDNPDALNCGTIYRIYKSRGDDFWLGTRNGLYKYNPESDAFIRIGAEKDQLGNNQVWAICEDSKGRFWLGTRYGGLVLLNRSSGVCKYYTKNDDVIRSLSDNTVWQILEDSDGNIWVTTAMGGLNLYHEETDSFSHFSHDPDDPYSISNNDFFWIMEDRMKTLWITSRRGGVNKLSPFFQRFEHIRHIGGNQATINDNNVYALCAEGDSVLWVGTSNGGLNKINRKGGPAKYFLHDPDKKTSIPSNTVYALYKSEDGNLWVGTSGGGLAVLNPKTERFTTYFHASENPKSISSDYITALAPAPDGNIWVATLGYGLDLFNPSEGAVLESYSTKTPDHALSDDTLYSLLPDPGGYLWIGTGQAGIDRLEISTGQIYNYPHNPAAKNSLSHSTVYSLSLGRDGMVWAGTLSGLNKLDPSTGIISTFSKRQGLPHDAIFGILEDNDTLWVSTGKGLACLSLSTGSHCEYDIFDGLQGNQFNFFSYHKSENGELFFGGLNGITAFRPEYLALPAFTPPIVFTGLEIYNRPVEVRSKTLPKSLMHTEYITIEPSQHVFAIFFAALTFQQTPHVTYQYKLQGFDKRWSYPTTKREATYTNLSPGEYTFMVKSTKTDGTMGDENIQSIKIVVLSPWWRKKSFITGVILVILLSLALLIRYRIQRLNTINRELEVRVKDRTKSLETANKDLAEQLMQIKNLQDNIKTLQNIIPICAHCKKIRNDEGYWEQVESYIEKTTLSTLTHGICPDCMKKYFPEVRNRQESEKKKRNNHEQNDTSI